MNCPKCGSPLANDAFFCVRCGTTIPEPTAARQPAYQQSVHQQPASQVRQGRKLPMNFYNAMVQWLMYGIAGLCVLIGIFYICRWNFPSGIRYLMKERDELIGVAAMNIIFGILMILVGGAWVGVRFMLNNYHKDSPKFTCLMFLLTGGVVFLYRIFAWAILAAKVNEGAGEFAMFSAYDGIMMGLFFFLLCAGIFYEVGRYFGKRVHLFR